MKKTRSDAQAEIVDTLGIGKSGRRRKKWKWIVGVLVLAAVVAVPLVTGKKKKVDAKDYFKTEAAQQGSLTVTVTATGSLEPTNQVDVGSEQSGIVESVAVTFNDRVTVGQELARLDPSKLEAQVMQSRASLEQAKAQLLQAQAAVREADDKLGRLKEVWALSGQKVPSKEDLDVAEVSLRKAQASEAAAKAQVSVAEAVLETNETDFSKLIVYSPVNGIVLSRDVEPGQTVQASFQAVTLFKLAEDLTMMELHVAVDEADVGQVAAGQKATFTVDAYPYQIFDAEVLQVRYGAETEQGVVTYETILSAENKDLLLRPGMTATAEIVVKKLSDVLLIPNSALRFSPSPVELARYTEKPNPAEKPKLGGEITPEAEAKTPEPEEPQDAESRKAAASRQKVWILREGKIMQVDIVIGETDMDSTEVTDGDLKSGDLLVTGTAGMTAVLK